MREWISTAMLVAAYYVVIAIGMAVALSASLLPESLLTPYDVIAILMLGAGVIMTGGVVISQKMMPRLIAFDASE